MSRGKPAGPELVSLRRRADTLSDHVPGPSAVSSNWSTAGGVAVLRCRPDAVGDRCLLWFHGGAYRLGSALGFRSWTAHLAIACAAEVVSVDYRLAPEAPFPDALTDAILAYEALRAEGHTVVVGGESAGAGLAAALLLALDARGLPLPAGAVLLSPWLDLRVTAASYTTNADSDALFSAASARSAAELYLNGHPATDPLVSPLLGDWSRQPPTLVQVSDTEVLRDDALALAESASCVRLEVFTGLPHAWHIGYPQAAGSTAAVESISRFVEQVAPVVFQRPTV